LGTFYRQELLTATAAQPIWPFSGGPKLTVKELNRRIKIEVFNTSDHAPYAMDLLPGKFRPPADQPEPRGVVVATGSRPVPGERGDVSGEGNARSTAERDWNVTFLQGGAMARCYQNGFRLGAPA